MASKIVRSGLGNVLVRRFASSSGPSAVAEHGGMRNWRFLSLVVALPGVGVCYLNAQLKEEEVHNAPRPEFKPYEHLRIRTKKFPWGDGNHSLFHNSHVNALPDGFEEDGH
ncbi:DgyrCDS9515 [Dimorphilus gyrociliatus]|uniref:Cytochrome c oxidase subunit n=1 Tax=Dimorphilus gyrociliatus TaxID=2664684 RepID=A0A7I8VX74_9ANNE|nr:DgyrCDS9515 [Dimorphilus gyrociliatus]